MIFFLDADFPENTTIIESSSWHIHPNFDDNGNHIGYSIYIQGYGDEYPLKEDSYKRLLNALRDNRTVNKIYLCRNKIATTDREG